MMDTILRLSDSVFLFVAALLKLAAAVIVPYLVWKIYLARHRRQLVVGHFVNGSGIADVDAAVAGLSVMARHRLVIQMDLVRSRVQDKSKVAGFDLQDKAPLPRGTPDQSLDALVSSLKGAMPKEAAPAVNIVRELILRPSGDQITTTLLALDGDGHRVGIIFEVTSLSGDEGHQPITLSEPFPPADEALAASPLERYIKLLDPAARLLALELSRREILIAGERTPMVERIRVRGGEERKARRKYFEATIHNFFGSLYQASAPSFAAHRDFFYDRAAQDFMAASSRAPEMYQPHENLADTYSLQARSSPDQAADAWHQRAVVEYQEAYVRTAHLADAGEREAAQRRIAIGQATSKLLSNDHAQWEEALKEIEALEEDWRPAAEKDGRILYNLASWHGLALGRNIDPDPSAKAKARTMLAYGLARDPRLISWATKDPDLQPLRDGLERLHIELAKKKVEVPELGGLPHRDFDKAMRDVLERAGWDDEGSDGS